MRRISAPARVPQGSCRDHRIMPQGPMGKLRRPNGKPGGDGKLPGSSAKSVLGEQLSASLRESLIEQIAAIISEDEAAAWAHRNLPAKNTLTAADAKMVEERFQARLSSIGGSGDPGGARASSGADSRALVPSGALPDPLHPLPNQRIASDALVAPVIDHDGNF